MDNLYIYNQGRQVPAEAQKSFHNGSFAGTDINPMWRIKKLTEVFGPAGFGWYTKVVRTWSEPILNEVCTHVEIELYVKDPETHEWSMPIVGLGGNKAQQFYPGKNGKPDTYKASDEAYKMAYTDAISVACKALGIGADIYFQNDPTKYSKYYDEQQQAPAVQKQLLILDTQDKLDYYANWCRENHCPATALKEWYEIDDRDLFKLDLQLQSL